MSLFHIYYLEWHPAKPKTGTSIFGFFHPNELQPNFQNSALLSSPFGQVTCFDLHEGYIPPQQF